MDQRSEVVQGTTAFQGRRVDEVEAEAQPFEQLARLEKILLFDFEGDESPVRITNPALDFVDLTWTADGDLAPGKLSAVSHRDRFRDREECVAWNPTLWSSLRAGLRGCLGVGAAFSSSSLLVFPRPLRERIRRYPGTSISSALHFRWRRARIR